MKLFISYWNIILTVEIKLGTCNGFLCFIDEIKYLIPDFLVLDFKTKIKQKNHFHLDSVINYNTLIFVNNSANMY